MPKHKALQGYALFLLKSDLAGEIASHTFERALKNHPEWVVKFDELSISEFNALIASSLEKFLKDIVADQAVDNILETYTRWKKNNYGFKETEINAEDILLGYTLRKNSLVSYLERYTTDPVLTLQIREELDALILIAIKSGRALQKQD